MRHVVGKLDGGRLPASIMLTERGTFFGYHRLVNDFIGLGDLMELGPPVCFDVTHSTQLPGADADDDGRTPRSRRAARPGRRRRGRRRGLHRVPSRSRPRSPTPAPSSRWTRLPALLEWGVAGWGRRGKRTGGCDGA